MRARGEMAPRTLKRLAVIRRMLKSGKSQFEIADAIGLHQTSVSRLVRAYVHGRVSRRGEHKKWASLQLPPIDPEKAARITADKRAWWEQQSRRSA